MKQFVASRLIKNEINTITGTLDEKNCTYSEKWYFNGRIYREEKRYCIDKESAEKEFDIACEVYSKNECSIIHM